MIIQLGLGTNGDWVISNWVVDPDAKCGHLSWLNSAISHFKLRSTLISPKCDFSGNSHLRS